MVGARETGNETYVTGLISGLTERNGLEEVRVYHVGRQWTGATTGVGFARLLTGRPIVRLTLELPIRSLIDRLDVIHMTYVAPLWTPAPIVLTVHDICYVSNPEWFSHRDLVLLRTMVPHSIRQAAHVITDSSEARHQIIETYGVDSDRVTAIPLGPGPAAEPISIEHARAILRDMGLDSARPFLLTVGNLQPRKNLTRLLEAFKEVILGFGHDIDLVIVGQARFGADEVRRLSEALGDRVHLTGYIDDRQLAACYKGCTAFVLPSLYEGFGLPVLEAMAHSIPVACSRAGSLVEVCGGAAIMFDPTSVADIAEQINRVISDSSLRSTLSQAGAKRVREFTWRRTADLTVEVYARARR